MIRLLYATEFMTKFKNMNLVFINIVFCCFSFLTFKKKKTTTKHHRVSLFPSENKIYC